jgi:hypothetical protein
MVLGQKSFTESGERNSLCQSQAPNDKGQTSSKG